MKRKEKTKCVHILTAINTTVPVTANIFVCAETPTESTGSTPKTDALVQQNCRQQDQHKDTHLTLYAKKDYTETKIKISSPLSVFSSKIKWA